jgi:Cu2+-exporting ATPase
VKKFLLTEKLPMETTIDESMISVNPFHWIKKQTIQLLQVQLTEINLCDDCRKNWFETFRKLCKWLIQPVAPEHRYKIGRQNSEVLPIVVAVSIITFVWAKFGPEPAIVYGFINAIAV